MTSVSISMAAYNGADFIAQQLQSFADQTRTPDELVVTDDGSRDGTVEVIAAFAATSSFPIRVERNSERLGLHRNFERALSLASGDIVLISDQDDIWYPNKVETIVTAFAQRADAIALHHDEHIFDQESGEILPGTLWERTSYLGGWDRHLAAGNCTALRREAVRTLLPLPPDFFYDEWINWIPAILDARIVLTEPLQLWRRHESNLSQPAVAERRQSRLLTYGQYGTADPRPGWTDYRRRLVVVKERIEARADELGPLLGAARVARTRSRIDDELGHIAERIRLVSLSKTFRWVAVLRAWSRGFYDDFSGWKSALKDMVVP